jgi:alkylphosphonate utilization operon protein PhnA
MKQLKLISSIFITLFLFTACSNLNLSPQDTLNKKQKLIKKATLRSGDDVTVIKDLKVKGSSSVVKVGTKIKSIRLVESADDHNIDCKIPGVGAIKITPKYVKKS